MLFTYVHIAYHVIGGQHDALKILVVEHLLRKRKAQGDLNGIKGCEKSAIVSPKADMFFKRRYAGIRTISSFCRGGVHVPDEVCYESFEQLIRDTRQATNEAIRPVSECERTPVKRLTPLRKAL